METHVKLKHDARTLELLKKHSLDYDRQGRRLPSANAIRKRAEQNSPRVLACARWVKHIIIIQLHYIIFIDFNGYWLATRNTK